MDSPTGTFFIAFLSPPDGAGWAFWPFNDLTSLAVHYAPEIKKILNDLGLIEGCLLSRMSGSGATCFGIFSGKKNVIKAKKTLLKLNPNYWISYGQIVGNK